MIHKRNTRLNILSEITILKKAIGVLTMNGYSVRHETIKHLKGELRDRKKWIEILHDLKKQEKKEKKK